jgi:hypothetical protein
MRKNPYPGSGMNAQDHIFEGLETVFLVKKIDADPDPGSGIFMTWIRDGKIKIWDPE